MSRLARAIASNYVLLAVQTSSLLLLAPLIISHFGTATFGRWSLILAITGYLRLLELGVGPTTARGVAIARTSSELNRAVSIAVAFLSGIALPTLVAAAAIGFAAGTRGGSHAFAIALAIAIASLAVQLPLSVAEHVLYGLDRIVQRNVFGTLRAVASLGAIVTTVMLGHGLAAFVAAGAVAEVLTAIAQLSFVRAVVPGIRLIREGIDPTHLRGVARVTTSVFGLSVASQVIVYSDTIVVGAFLGAAATGVYSIAMRAIDGGTRLLNQTSDAFFPRFAIAHASGNNADAGDQVAVATRVTACLSFAVIAVYVAFGQQLIHAWVGSGFQGAWLPLIMLSASLAFNAPLRLAVLWAIANNRHGPIARRSLVEAVANLALTLALVEPFGIQGVAAASLVTFAIWNGYVLPRLILPEVGRRWWNDFACPIVSALAAVIPISIGIHFAIAGAQMTSSLTVVCSGIWFLLALVLLWYAVLSDRDRQLVLSAIRRGSSAGRL